MENSNSCQGQCVYEIWLSCCKNVGSVRAKLLMDYFGSAQAVYKTTVAELRGIEGINPDMLSDLTNKDTTYAENILSDCRSSGISVLSITDNEYPERLRNIYNPPIVLYVNGTLPQVDSLPVIGIVGTRECTPYGVKHSQALGRELTGCGFIIATGLARGIDTAAAEGALKSGGPVIGVVGCGVDVVYPKRNRNLFAEVIKTGAVISEYPPGTEAMSGFFPARNRIISGLSVGVAVIEAPEKSGALITAARAVEQGRDVFVLPANVDAKSCAGSNKLLREGAIAFLSPDDIAEEYKNLFPIVIKAKTKKPIDNNAPLDYIDKSNLQGFHRETPARISDSIIDKLAEGFDGNAKDIAKTMGHGPLYIDEIVAKTGIGAGAALASLTALELDGHVRRDISGKWEINV